MPRKRYRMEQIVTKLRQAEVDLRRGLRVSPGFAKNSGSVSGRLTGGGRSTEGFGSTRRSV